MKLVKSCEWIDVKNILIEMNSEGVKPDRLTLLYIFQGLSNFNIQANLPIALAILAEFKILDIQPCLGKEVCNGGVACSHFQLRSLKKTVGASLIALWFVLRQSFCRKK